MGEFDGGLFLEAMKKKYNEDEAEVRATNMCSLWEHYVKDSTWHPFKFVTIDGETRVCFYLTYLSFLETEYLMDLYSKIRTIWLYQLLGKICNHTMRTNVVGLVFTPVHFANAKSNRKLDSLNCTSLP